MTSDFIGQNEDIIRVRDKRVLIVDDDEVIRNFVGEVLEEDGYQVVTLGTAQAALDAAQKEDFHVVIADLKLGGENGIELIKSINAVRPGVPCIVMTGYGTLDLARAAIRQGVYDFVLKPFNHEEIRASVRSALERSLLAEENAGIRQLAGLFEASKAISALMDVRKLPHLVLGAALSQTHALRGFVAVREMADGQFRIASFVGWDFAAVRKANRLLKNSLFTKAIMDGKMILVTPNDEHPLKMVQTLLSVEPQGGNLLLPIRENEELMMLPLKSPTEVLGALVVSKDVNVARFTYADLQMLTVLTRHSGVALANSFLMSDLQDTYLSTFKSLIITMEARDPIMHGHSQRVTAICEALAKELDLDPEMTRHLQYAAALHDIGKLGISEAILNKKGELTEEEWAQIRKHPETAYRMLEPIKFLSVAREILMRHHERGDGSGYPFGLRFEELTRADHILIVADMFDAMNSDRAYRDYIRPPEILRQLSEMSDIQLSREVVEALKRLFKAGKIPART